jgi:hypothetical protein
MLFGQLRDRLFRALKKQVDDLFVCHGLRLLSPSPIHY